MLKPPTEKITAETREKLLALADHIQADQTRGFFMGFVVCPSTEVDLTDLPECGTAGCIAGHVGFMLGRNTCDGDYMSSIEAGQYLGLTKTQRGELFHPWSAIASKDRAKAVRVLRNFAYTGDVDWSV